MYVYAINYSRHNICVSLRSNSPFLRFGFPFFSPSTHPADGFVYAQHAFTSATQCSLCYICSKSWSSSFQLIYRLSVCISDILFPLPSLAGRVPLHHVIHLSSTNWSRSSSLSLRWIYDWRSLRQYYEMVYTLCRYAHFPSPQDCRSFVWFAIFFYCFMRLMHTHINPSHWLAINVSFIVPRKNLFVVFFLLLVLLLPCMLVLHHSV